MTNRHDKTPAADPLTDTGERRAIVDEVVDRVRDEITGGIEMARSTPTPRETTDMALAAGALERQREAEKGARLVTYDYCEKEGPIWKLREELKKKDEEREKSMRRTIMIATFVLTAVTGGIQLWGKWSATQANAGELAKAITDLRAEVRTMAERNGEHRP